MTWKGSGSCVIRLGAANGDGHRNSSPRLEKIVVKCSEVVSSSLLFSFLSFFLHALSLAVLVCQVIAALFRCGFMRMTCICQLHPPATPASCISPSLTHCQLLAQLPAAITCLPLRSLCCHLTCFPPFPTGQECLPLRYSSESARSPSYVSTFLPFTWYALQASVPTLAAHPLLSPVTQFSLGSLFLFITRAAQYLLTPSLAASNKPFLIASSLPTSSSVFTPSILFHPSSFPCLHFKDLWYRLEHLLACLLASRAPY